MNKPTLHIKVKRKNNERVHFQMFFTTIFLSLLFVWEGYSQRISPDKSILAFLQNLGFFKNIPIIYESGKGIWHPAGWLGSALLILMLTYTIRKRFSFMTNFGNLKVWLNTHIFMGLIGPVLITAHTTLKFGGIVSISFWSMILTSLSGIVGRYIYIQIPRNLTGSELKIDEINNLIKEINNKLKEYPHMFELIENITTKHKTGSYEIKKKNIFLSTFYMIRKDIDNILILKDLKTALDKHPEISYDDKISLVALCKDKIKLNKKFNFLSVSHHLFHYWHIAHLPLSVIMFLIMFIHIFISYSFKVY